MNKAYIRVSSVDQNTDRQLANVSIQFDKVYTEKVSAKDVNRPQLQIMLEHIVQGDHIHVHSMCRLARDQRDLRNIVQRITDAGASITFYKESLTFNGDDNAFSLLMLNILGAVSEFERSIINERRKEGQQAAKAKGKHIGRPKASSSRDDNIIKALKEGKSAYQIAKDLKVSRNTVAAIKKKLEAV